MGSGINSLRIGLIGITVEYWGPAMAEGLLHDVEGWFMFMLCIAQVGPVPVLVAAARLPCASCATAPTMPMQ